MKTSYYQESDLIVIENRIFTDERGLFSETFNEALFRLNTGLNIQFVQDNESISHKNVFRGFHFQIPPKSQAKLIRVVHGAIIDFAIDLRASSNKFGCIYSIELTGENKKQFYIPEGFAHGFIALEDHTIVNYKCSQYYSPESERSLLFNDANLSVKWPIPLENLIVSDKDKKGQLLTEFSDIFI
jgi:dTDP-4-dehydrorhamnose 3,5-epimerase